MQNAIVIWRTQLSGRETLGKISGRWSYNGFCEARHESEIVSLERKIVNTPTRKREFAAEDYRKGASKCPICFFSLSGRTQHSSLMRSEPLFEIPCYFEHIQLQNRSAS